MRLEHAVRVLLLVAVAAGCGGAPEQPIPFNHKLHVTKGALQCESCHEYVYERAYASFPPVRTCMKCHKNDAPDAPKGTEGARHIELIRSHAKEGTAIGWKRVYQLPSHVFFSHRRHTEVGEIECTRCHGEMKERTTPPRYPIEETLDMDGCMDCHRERKVTVDCAACHR